jgi:hypothetical protein
MVNQRLKDIYRNIKELKEKKYVGTQQAWEYLKQLDRIEAIPQLVSKIVNASKNSLNKVAPNILISLSNRLNKLDDQLRESERRKNQNGEHYRDFALSSGYENWESLVRGRYPIYNIWNFIRGSTKYDMSIGETADFFRSIGIYGKNEDIGQRAINHFFEKNVFLDGDYSIGQVKEIAKGIDWDFEFSEIAVNKIKEGAKLEAFIDNISIYDRIKIIMRDKVDHRLDRRREIIKDFILEAGGVEDYGDVLDSMNVFINIFGSGGGNKELNKYLEMCISSEKRYIEKLLKETLD